MNRTQTDSRQDFSAREGQYLAFIQTYTLVNGRPPAQADIMRFFRVTPPTVLADPAKLPDLKPLESQPVKTSVMRYYTLTH